MAQGESKTTTDHETTGGELSRFFKFVSCDTAELQ